MQASTSNILGREKVGTVLSVRYNYVTVVLTFFVGVLFYFRFYFISCIRTGIVRYRTYIYFYAGIISFGGVTLLFFVNQSATTISKKIPIKDYPY